MSDEVLTGIVTGVLSSLVVPCVNAWFKERRTSKAYRRERIAEFRKALDGASSIAALRGKPAFVTLFDNLPDNERKSFFEPVFVMGGGVDGERLKIERLSRVADELERLWKVA